MSKYKKTRAECATGGSETPDGTPISGHAFVAVIAFKDIDSERWYDVLLCEDCGHAEASFTDDSLYEDHAKKAFPVVQELGGAREL